MARYAKISALSFKAVQNDGLEVNAERYKEKVMQHLLQQIEAVAGEMPDLVILPEASNRPAGLSLAERMEYYEHTQQDFENFIASLAVKYNTNIAFACIRIDNNPPDREYPCRNSVLYFNRKGKIVGTYDKCYLVPTEHTVAKIGFGKLPDKLIDLDFGRVATAICFDMHDMTLLERYAALSPDLIVFPSNFAARAWADTWALRCSAYFAASLGIGLHKMGRIINPFGDIVATTAESAVDRYHATATLNFDCTIVHNDDNQDWRTYKFDAAKKKYGDGFNWVNSNGGGVSLIQCDIPDKTIDDIIDEFDIVRLENYFPLTYKLRKEYYEKIGYEV